ncbi:MAG: DUF1289 domain-containing protein [Thalassolituus sp.]|jgi:predicted Fe-S protein YdhL (DUF1289 family)|uniref:Predicted Fe-S protein n=2 Tax=root TaxID=1 RepID=M5DRJ9_9GAMM|nr:MULTISPECIES: DUF1289 domain-containing protein [Thalassolituus]MBL1232719.1 DUF1289 domain-containing protein [Flavobacteriales bacterium]PCI47880.1 MAG: DUF1289 domain-containing protein [Oceanospirillales bacterium]PHQ87511.1 MAG: DUF1289 domain-containing protein [Thalassobium sp.]AHK16149.1 Fe-S oxidoreductase [Thalassolituus oleivorans R6-15]MBQ0729005.1 DUF1289 domain-containing protein [Thalassolituus oleivorans]|tara:strand:- start:132 stop:326 length:195 start_codon:yes stop_codon:yes gene_type:complete
MTTPVRSPCVSICALDENDLCVGCYRTGEEITRWGAYSNDERRQVLQKVGERERSAMNFIPVND